jgi:hypothetical protein
MGISVLGLPNDHLNSFKKYIIIYYNSFHTSKIYRPIFRIMSE